MVPLRRRRQSQPNSQNPLATRANASDYIRRAANSSCRCPHASAQYGHGISFPRVSPLSPTWESRSEGGRQSARNCSHVASPEVTWPSIPDHSCKVSCQPGQTLQVSPPFQQEGAWQVEVGALGDYETCVFMMTDGYARYDNPGSANQLPIQRRTKLTGFVDMGRWFRECQQTRQLQSDVLAEAI